MASASSAASGPPRRLTRCRVAGAVEGGGAPAKKLTRRSRASESSLGVLNALLGRPALLYALRGFLRRERER